jgi:predicted ribosome quality control (RQC) complex YloA/Tae2 family protein
MHARGYSGSHLVIRMNRSRENPPREVLMKAASYAAFFSQARGSSMVPVSFTRKKYVRKPKGSDPGQVVIDKEDVVLVAPQKPGRN